MPESPVLLSALVFLCVFVPFLVADSFARMERPAAGRNPVRDALPASLRGLFPAMLWGAQAFGAPLCALRPRRAEALRKRLLLANLPLSPEMVLGSQAALAAAGVLFGLVVFALSANAGAAVSLAALVAFCGWFFPPTALESRAENRRAQIVRDLPFAIDLVGSAMHAGLDFNAALRHYVGLGIKNPLSEEFAQTLRESELGKSRVEALRAMAERVQTPVFTSFVDAVSHGIEVGASLVGTMRMQGEDMRRARFHLAEEKAARATSLMILPMAVFIVPAVFVMVFVPVWFRFKASRGG